MDVQRDLDRQDKIQKELIRRRREIMWRLYNNPPQLSMQKIGDIYGCKRQYIQQEIKAYQQEQQ